MTNFAIPPAIAGTTAVLAAVIGHVNVAFGQDGQMYTDASPEAFYPEPTPPRDLPGHETGAREKPTEEEPEAAPLAEWFGGEAWWNWSRATGDWGGTRTSLEDAGIAFEGAAVFDWSTVLDGGVNDASSYRHLLDANVTFDLDTMFGLAGATVFVDFYSTAGDSISADAGDFQGVSNIETDADFDLIAELWYEQWFFDDFLRIKFGKVEANSEFAFVDAAGEFICGSAGVSPTIFTIPTYPDPAMGLNVFMYPSDHLYVGLGFYDGAASVDGVRTGARGPKTFFDDDLSDDYFWIGEFGCTWDELKSLGGGRFAIGAWHHTGDFDRFDGGVDDGAEGLFALIEQQVWAENPDVEDDEQGVTVFGQYGYADQDLSEVAHHIGGGLSWIGPISGRDDDATGAMLSYIDLSDEPGSGFVDDETILELFYKVQLTPAVSIKPDMQFIFDPSGDSTVDDAIVGALRVEIAF